MWSAFDCVCSLVRSTDVDAEAPIDFEIRVQLGRPMGRPFAL
jgi:hypothetical protein